VQEWEFLEISQWCGTANLVMPSRERNSVKLELKKSVAA
jgi:hypothetical protein